MVRFLTFAGVLTGLFFYGCSKDAKPTVPEVKYLAPSITVQPKSQTVMVGKIVAFTVTATGNPAPTYQWRKSDVDISGATDSIYTITNAAPSHAGTYNVYVLNSQGGVLSNSVVLSVISDTTTWNVPAPELPTTP
ncbi:MAG: immunoglobulin domain-containing protein [Fibrobacteres bacterium]|nr:immunoglobulin domain-containing protein [Fibrobacterota bacterium]